MDDQWVQLNSDDDVEESTILFILPCYVSELGFSCAREWTEHRLGHECGCPRCLHKAGITLIFHLEDWNDTGDQKAHWRKRIVSIKTASYASHLICPGYERDVSYRPGGPPVEE